MKARWCWILGVVCLGWLGGATPSSADPCGMVPPPYTGPGVPIKRVGPQKTYVFYKRGVESIVLRPAFSGKVDNFGMLIPFPTPPSIRKVPDNIFSHIAAAIDPPEIPVYLWRRRRYRRYRSLAAAPAMRVKRKAKVAKREVRVLRQEAVGMYQVAVLEAGSAKALNRWMSKNGYKYPKGMDKPTNDYIQKGWCFVAVKTRVAGKKSVQPRPGMRRAKPKFPVGGSFDGAVQAMGFRFKSRQLVVPMRLSAFNAGRLRNVVYILAEGPRAIRNIPQKYVVRQLSGKELYRNVTELLPIRVYGGQPHQIPRHRWSYIQRRRRPGPHNGLARTLFASDLRAVSLGKLVLEHETRKKQLLNIGEALKLRGQHIDQSNRKAIQQELAYTVQESLQALRGMTMSVVDGDFPRKVLARENLTFPRYRMAKAKRPKKGRRFCRYNARFLRRRCTYDRGVLTRWQGPMYARPPAPRIVKKPVYKRRRVPKNARTIYQWILRLGNPKTSAQAAQKLREMGVKAIPYLIGESLEGSDAVQRGWSIVVLSDSSRRSVKRALKKISEDSKQPHLVRTWAFAARIKQETTLQGLQAYMSQYYRFRALQRPMRLKIQELLQSQKNVSLRQLFRLSQRFYFLRRMLMPMAEKTGPWKLAKIMTRDKDTYVRRQAASYLAALGRKQASAVAKATIRIYRFRPKARKTPWHGGALYVPSISWDRREAKQLVRQLLSWYIWCSERKQGGQLRQIHNNIRSLRLARAAGYRSPGWRNVGLQRWMIIWKNATSCSEVRQMFRIQNAVQTNASLLESIGCP